MPPAPAAPLTLAQQYPVGGIAQQQPPPRAATADLKTLKGGILVNLVKLWLGAGNLKYSAIDLAQINSGEPPTMEPGASSADDESYASAQELA